MMRMATELAAVLLAIALAVINVGAGWLRFLQTVPRSVWLSLGSGVSVAYVFVHLLPEITARQAQLVESADRFTSLPLSTREHLLFLAVLLGFGVYYGVELFANGAKRENGQETTGSRLAGPSARGRTVHGPPLRRRRRRGRPDRTDRPGLSRSPARPVATSAM